MRKHGLGFALSLSLLGGLVAPALSSAATTVGSTPPPGVTIYADCSADTGHTTRTNTVTNPYIATASGVITEWQFNADATGNPGSLALQTLTGDGMTLTFAPVQETAVESPVAGQLSTFDARIPITAGQFIGLRVVTASHGCFTFVSSMGEYTNLAATPAPLVGGGPQMYGGGTGNAATNVAATIEPDADADGFGDETQDGCPDNAARNDDCVKPQVTIDKGPRKQSRKRRATFFFSSDEEGATFECSLDGKRFTICASPLKVKKLKPRKHTFSVRAVDVNSNKSGEADYRWKVKKKKKKKK